MILENIIIIILVIAFLFLYGMALFQFLTLLYYSFEKSDFKRIEKQSVDDATLEILKPLEDFLCSKKFRYIAMVEHESSIVGNAQKYHIAYYYNDTNGVHAFVKTQPFLGAQEPATIVYKTFFTNGRRVETVNGMKHFIPSSPKHVALYDYYLAEDEAIYLAHLKDVKKELDSVKMEPIPVEKLVAYKTQDEKEYIKSWEDTGIIKTNENGYRFRISWAMWKFAMQSVKGQKKYANIVKNKKKDMSLSKNRETHAILTQLDELDKARGKSNKKLWFIVSMLFFILVLTLIGLTFVDIVLLIVVLIVHELGHYAAMRYYGYADTSIFFLPFGAAAIGKKEHRRAYEEYVVSLAGPLPGMIIGTVILLWSLFQGDGISRDNILVMYAIFSLVINYINLLPIYPLDGGRVLQLLLLHRYPKGQFYFYLISLTLLIVAMVWLQDPVLLIFVVIVALGLRQSYRVSQFLSKLFKKFTPTELDKTTVVKQIVEDEHYDTQTLYTKANLAKQTLHIIQTSKPSRWLVGFGMLFYLLLLTPPFAVKYVMSQSYTHSEYSKLPKEAQKRLDTFHEKLTSLEGLTKEPVENYTLEESMATLEKYLYDEDINRTVGNALAVTEKSNLSAVPKALQKLYTWHNGITQLLPERDFFSLEKMQENHKDLLQEVREYEDANFTTPYRIFISAYGNSGLAYHLNKKGIFYYSPYSEEEDNTKHYYSVNHLLKLTAEAYKTGAYTVDYGELIVDDAKFSKLKRDYLSQADKARYEESIAYLKERALAFRDSPHDYVKKEVLWALGDTYDSRVIPSVKLYLDDKSKKVRQQAVNTLGVLGDRSVIPLLMSQLDDAPLHCKGCALSGLSYLVTKNDTALLEKIHLAVDDNKMWIRRNAYRTIGYIGSKISLPLLKERFKEEHPACKLAMVEAFGRIGDKGALQLLKEYLKEIEKMDFSLSYENRSRSKNPHPNTLKYEVQKAIDMLGK